jgi:hypothetical protein
MSSSSVFVAMAQIRLGEKKVCLAGEFSMVRGRSGISFSKRR